MDYYQQDFMIKLGETPAGDVLEIPDLIVYGLAIGFVFTLIMIAIQKDKK